MNQDEWNSAIQDNLFSCFALISAFGQYLRTNNVGRFIFMSSVVSRIGSFGASHYAAAKSGIEGLVRSGSHEFSPSGVTMNAIAPGYMDTGIIRSVPESAIEKLITVIPQHRLGPSAEIAALVQFLLSENASYISGQVIGIDGGL
jgi:acetoacetyl-CoA reductase